MVFTGCGVAEGVVSVVSVGCVWVESGVVVGFGWSDVAEM